jgi:hypothetical protein
MDETLSVLDAHPNIEVRRFHPYAKRNLRLAELATGFAHLNSEPRAGLLRRLWIVLLPILPVECLL